MTAVLVDNFCGSFDSLPAAITLDIDDTCDAVPRRRLFPPAGRPPRDLGNLTAGATCTQERESLQPST